MHRSEALASAATGKGGGGRVAMIFGHLIMRPVEESNLLQVE